MRQMYRRHECGGHRCVQVQCVSCCQTYPRVLHDLLPAVSARIATSTYLAVRGVSVSQMPNVRCSTRQPSHVQSRGTRWLLVLFASSLSTLLRVSCGCPAGVRHDKQDEVQRLDLRHMQALPERPDQTKHVNNDRRSQCTTPQI